MSNKPNPTPNPSPNPGPTSKPSSNPGVNPTTRPGANPGTHPNPGPTSTPKPAPSGAGAVAPQPANPHSNPGGSPGPGSRHKPGTGFNSGPTTPREDRRTSDDVPPDHLARPRHGNYNAGHRPTADSDADEDTAPTAPIGGESGYQDVARDVDGVPARANIPEGPLSGDRRPDGSRSDDNRGGATRLDEQGRNRGDEKGKRDERGNPSRRGGGGGTSIPWSDHTDPPPPHVQPVGWTKLTNSQPAERTMVYLSDDATVSPGYFEDENGLVWFRWNGEVLDFVPTHWKSGPYHYEF